MIYQNKIDIAIWLSEVVKLHRLQFNLINICATDSRVAYPHPMMQCFISPRAAHVQSFTLKPSAHTSICQKPVKIKLAGFTFENEEIKM